MRLITHLLAVVAAVVPGVALAGDDLTQAKASDLNPGSLVSLEQAIAHGDYPNTTSVLIVRNGELAYERYFGEGSVEFLNNTRSATKFITTLALGAAISDGSRSEER